MPDATMIVRKDDRALPEGSAPESSTSVVTLIETLILLAHESGASDIHIHPEEDVIRVRFRIDGTLSSPAPDIPHDLLDSLMMRIKVLAGLRTDQRHAPQDGRFRHICKDGTAIDIRVALAPTFHGEHATLRLLYPHDEGRTLEALGFSTNHISLIDRALERTQGLILATGPTGSGKTTTLYTLLKRLDRESRSIITIEDPIEYHLPSVTQIQTNDRAGLTFARGLRSILRHDPDVIMVGEIRDAETARLALHAALTGHLVLSTLHTNDALGAIPRLLEMGIERYLLAATLSLIIGQQLARRLCADCKESEPVREAMATDLERLALPYDEDGRYGHPRGCRNCDKRGYRGRVGIYETVRVDGGLRELLAADASQHELMTHVRSTGTPSILEDGLSKARVGDTSIPEILRLHYD